MVNRFALCTLALTMGAATYAQKGHVPPSVAETNATKLVSGIKWNDSLEAALATAKRENKLVFYMHMLGKIAGDT